MMYYVLSISIISDITFTVIDKNISKFKKMPTLLAINLQV